MVLLISVISLILVSPGFCVDRTQESGANGAAVVDAVLDKIQTSCVFPDDDKLLLRRLAYVLTNDGKDPSTYRAGYNGGIWQVDENQYLKTKSEKSLKNVKDAIEKDFKILWSETDWSDLRKPLYSALAARLFFLSLNKNIERSIPQQALFLSNNYNKTFNFTAQYATKLKDFSKNCKIVGNDIVFVLDGSGSVKDYNFVKVKEFVKDVVDAFEIAKDKTRIGVIQFSKTTQIEFHLKDSFNKEEIKRKIDDIKYIKSSTYTHLAIDQMVNESFIEANGARPAEEGRPKIGIILTDGKSENAVWTAAAAKRARAAGIVLYAVGIGSGITRSELESIGSKPLCTHVFTLQGFDEVQSFVNELETRSCKEPAPVKIGTTVQGLLVKGQMQFFSLNVNTRVGASLKVSMSSGSSTLYVSQQVKNPSEASYEQKAVATTSAKAELFVKPTLVFTTVGGGARLRRAASSSNDTFATVYAVLEGGDAQKNEFKLIGEEGDTRSGSIRHFVSITSVLTAIYISLSFVL